MIKITIPGDISVSLNLLLDLCKTHWSKYYKMSQDTVSLIYYYLKAQKVKPVEKYPVRIKITWYAANKRRDPDNLASSKKFLIDALVKAGVLRNDGWEETSGGFEDNFYIDKLNPRIEISIT